MAIKNRSTLINDSDATFLDNTSGQIIPANHRTFNDDVIDSAAMVVDTNTFTENNEFQKITFVKNLKLDLGQYTWDASSIAPINFFTGNNPSTIEGNVFTIINDGAVVGVNGLAGTIYYAIHTGNVLWDSSAGFMTPNISIQMFPNDVLIFILNTDTTIRVLGIHRSYEKNTNPNGQEYFSMADLAAYQIILGNKSLQVGSKYLIPQGYEVDLGGIVKFDILVTAVTSDKIDENVFLKKNGTWFKGLCGDSNLMSGTITTYDNTDLPDAFQLVNIDQNSVANFFQNGASSAVMELAHQNIGSFHGRILFDSSLNPIRKNVFNFFEGATAWFGRFLFSDVDNAEIFIPHHGLFKESWGNSEWQNGLAPSDLIDINDFLGNTISLVTITHGVYQVVNDVCTIHVNVSCEATFNQGVGGHEFLLYFPLPFANNYYNQNVSGGHGSLRFVDINNHMNIGAIVEPFDQNLCLVSAKYSSAITTPTMIDIGFTFSYYLVL